MIKEKYGDIEITRYSDQQVEELVTCLAREYPDKVVMRAYTPTFMYGKHGVAVKTRIFKTMGYTTTGEDDVQMTEMHIEEIRDEIRKNDATFIYQVILAPLGNESVVDYGWKIRYATLNDIEEVSNNDIYTS